MKSLKLITSLLMLLSVAILQAQDTYLIDNFAPYIKKVEISTGGEIIYQEEWTWDSEAAALNYSMNCKNAAANGDYDVVILIYTSESMQSLELSIDQLVSTAPAEKYNSQGTEWYYIIDDLDIDAIYNAQTLQQLNISINGQDQNGNAIQGFNKLQTSIPIDELKKRISSTEWSGNGSFAPDTRHVLKVGTAPESATGCLFAAFEAVNTTIADDEKAVFINHSYGGASEWHWTFDGGNPATSVGEGPHEVDYPAAGNYSVTLTVSDGNTSHTETKNAYIHVTKTEAYFEEIDFSYDPTQNKFTGQASGNPTGWSWKFMNTPTTQPGQVVTHVLNTGVIIINEVTLTVTYSTGSKSKTQRIFNCGYPFTE